MQRDLQKQIQKQDTDGERIITQLNEAEKKQALQEEELRKSENKLKDRLKELREKEIRDGRRKESKGVSITEYLSELADTFELSGQEKKEITGLTNISIDYAKTNLLDFLEHREKYLEKTKKYESSYIQVMKEIDKQFGDKTYMKINDKRISKEDFENITSVSARNTTLDKRMMLMDYILENMKKK